MKTYRLECSGTCREVYIVEAEDGDHAREQFARGAVDTPLVTECSTDIDSMEEVS